MRECSLSLRQLDKSLLKSRAYMPQCVLGTRAVMLKRPKALQHDQRTFSRAETQSHVSRSFRLSGHCQRAVKHSTALKNYRHADVISHKSFISKCITFSQTASSYPECVDLIFFFCVLILGICVIHCIKGDNTSSFSSSPGRDF